MILSSDILADVPETLRPELAVAISMSRGAELQLGAVWRAPNAATWRSALHSRELSKI